MPYVKGCLPLSASTLQTWQSLLLIKELMMAIYVYIYICMHTHTSIPIHINTYMLPKLSHLFLYTFEEHRVILRLLLAIEAIIIDVSCP